MSLFETRIQKVFSFMQQQAIEMVMITSPINIYYFTGFYSYPAERFQALIFSAERQEVSLYLPNFDVEIAEQHSYIKSFVPISDTDQPYQILKKEQGQKMSSIGLEKGVVSLRHFELLSESYPEATFKDIEAFIISLRLRKTSEEIVRVKKAIAVAEQALDYGVQKVEIGMSELNVAEHIENQVKALGADRLMFAPFVQSGPNTAIPHAQAGTRKIQEGDFLLIDLFFAMDGYFADITRTFVIGEPSEKQVQIYQGVLDANCQAIAAVHAGIPFKQIDQAARDHIASIGYGEYFHTRLGHGLGLEVHEPPSIHPLNEEIMSEGFLFTIEPGIYIPGFGGVRIEDDVYIGEDGIAEVLTSYPKTLQKLCLR